MKTILHSRLLSCCLCWSSLSLFLWILTHPSLGNVVADEKTDDVCTRQTTCGACISASPNCSWCKDVPFDKIRCDRNLTLNASGCPWFNIVNPQAELKSVEDQPLSGGVKSVQMKPQKVQLRLRAHESAEVPFEFYLAQDYAVDMYFLMDLSNTMKIHIERLANVSKQLVSDIKNLTNSLYVGIGSFVDKNILPYSFPNTCSGSTCEEKYDFKQMIKLTNEFTHFQTTVDKLKNMTTENLDLPEAGLDAVLQSIVCEDIIGWRKESRRLIIYSSDGPFHYGGDGKLGGIMIPNDGRCHLNTSRYTEGKNQDYPSVGQIAYTIQKNQITVIFAVSRFRLETYQNFVKNIQGAYVSELNTQKSTIAEIVKERYKNISSSVEMTVLNKDMNITFMSKCTGSTWMNRKHCDNLKPKQTVEFKALIPPQKCPPGKKKVVKDIVIMPIGLKKKIHIELEVICGCDCDNLPVIKSQFCENFGNLTCGKCYCDNPALSQKCIKYNTTTECSNRGSCVCGKCFCDKIRSSENYYYGEFCQCNDYSCPNFNGEICGGPSHGKCECNRCKCKSAFTGDNCGCPIDSSTCVAKNNKICNGYGKCVCGVCQCDRNSGYKGKTCENCPICGKCGKFEECVKCILSQKKKDTKKCTGHCYEVPVEIVETLEDKKKANDACIVEINECIVRYRYSIEKIAILKKQDCTKNINLVALILGIIGGILFAGIVILVIWKVVTTIQDKRELARFNDERNKAKWTSQTNPLYVKAETTFRNPMWNSNPDL